MQTLRRFESWLQDRLTRGFVWLNYSSVDRTDEFSLSDTHSEEVYLFSCEKQVIGQNTPFQSIIINERYYSQLSQSSQECVLRHELSHRDRSWLARSLFWAMITTGAVGVFGIVISLALLLVGTPLLELVEPTGMSLLFIAVGVITNRLEETTADLQALHVVGEEDFLNTYNEVASVTERTLTGKVFGTLFYTQPERTVCLYRFLRRFGIMA